LFFYAFDDLTLSRLEAGIFLGTLLAFIVFSFFRESNEENGFENLEEKSFTRTMVFFVFSFGGLIMGAELALRGGVALGQMAGLSERVIAITIISAGTGLPELATSVAAAFRGHSEIAIANVIGSNIFNTLAIPGATASFFALQIDDQFLNLDFYVMTGATASVLLLYAFKNIYIRRALGVSMFVAYSAYALTLIFATTA
jgi:cation:H+ antiporter